MNFDVNQLNKRDRYLLLTNVVVPRPIAWVTTCNAEGNVNAAPFSFFNVMSTTPPVLGIGIGAAKDTVNNILETKEFVVNIVSEDLAEKMNITAIEFPSEESEIRHAGLHLRESHRIKSPGILESPVQIECTFRDVLNFDDEGNLTQCWVMGDIVHIHVEDSCLVNDRIPYERLNPLGRLGGSIYTRVNSESLFTMKRLSYEPFQNDN